MRRSGAAGCLFQAHVDVGLGCPIDHGQELMTGAVEDAHLIAGLQPHHACGVCGLVGRERHDLAGAVCVGSVEAGVHEDDLSC